jgi:MipA family protein
VEVRAVKTPRTEVDVGFSASLGSHSSDIEARRGMAGLGNMIEFGPRLNVNLGDVSEGHSDSRLQFPLREVIDVSHSFSSRGVAFEPQWVTGMRLPKRWFISTNLGAMIGDNKLADTFYRVAPSEVTPTRASYNAKSGLIALRAGLLALHTLTPDVRLFFIMRIESLAGAANRDSPLVRREGGWPAGVGLAWALARTEQNARD